MLQWTPAVSGKTTHDWLVLNHCHHDIQKSLDNIFNDLTAWCERIDVAQNTDQLTGDLTTFKINFDMLFQFLVNIPSQADPQLYALEIVQYLQQTRNALYGVQGSVAQLGNSNSSSTTLIIVDAQHCLDQLLETTVRVYRIVAVTLHAYVDTIQARDNAEAAAQEIATESIVTVVGGISRQIKELQRSVNVEVTVESSPHDQSSANSPISIGTVPDMNRLQLQRCADGYIDPDILRTSHSPPIDYQRLYALADWSDKYDDSAAAMVVRKEQQLKQQQHLDNTTITASTEALVTHGHPVVIYSQNGFAHQLQRYRHRLNRLFHLFYTRLADVFDDESLAGSAIREHLDSVQTALITIVQYTSRLTLAVVHSKLCPLTFNTGLRSIVLLVRQLMLTAETFNEQQLGSRDGLVASNEVFDILVSVSHLVAEPLQRINELMDFVDGGMTESALAEHVTKTLAALVDSFRPLDAQQQCGRAPRWSADAVRTYILSLDEVLKNFRTMPGDGEVSQLELHTIRQSVSKVMRRMQYIHQDCAAEGRMDSNIYRHLQRAMEHLTGIDEKLTDVESVDRMKGLGNRCVGMADENGDRWDRSSWHGHVAGNARQIVQAISVFHGSNSSELVSTTTTTTTSTERSRAATSADAVTNVVGDL